MESFKILERIGEGTHGQVVQAMERSTGKIVAIKCVRSSDKVSKNLLREIESLKALDSDYVCYINIIRKLAYISAGPRYNSLNILYTE